MSLSITQIIEARAPQWSGDPRISTMIQLATQQTGNLYCNNKNLAIALLVLHWFAIEAQNGGDPGTGSSSGSGSAGSISQKKEGDLSISYKTTEGKFSSALDSTIYGKELLDLRDSSLIKFRNRFTEDTC